MKKVNGWNYNGKIFASLDEILNAGSSETLQQIRKLGNDQCKIKIYLVPEQKSETDFLKQTPMDRINGVLGPTPTNLIGVTAINHYSNKM